MSYIRNGFTNHERKLTMSNLEHHQTPENENNITWVNRKYNQATSKRCKKWQRLGNHPKSHLQHWGNQLRLLTDHFQRQENLKIISSCLVKVWLPFSLYPACPVLNTICSRRFLSHPVPQPFSLKEPHKGLHLSLTDCPNSSGFLFTLITYICP